MAKKRCCCTHIGTFQMIINFGPHISIIPFGRPVIDAPRPELYSTATRNETNGFHVTKPNGIMGCHYELRIGKLLS